MSGHESRIFGTLDHDHRCNLSVTTARSQLLCCNLWFFFHYGRLVWTVTCCTSLRFTLGFLCSNQMAQGYLHTERNLSVIMVEQKNSPRAEYIWLLLVGSVLDQIQGVTVCGRRMKHQLPSKACLLGHSLQQCRPSAIQ